MANKFFNKDAVPSKQSSAKGPPTQKSGTVPEMKMKTANWPGAGGKTQSKDRSGGTPKKGHMGSFHVKQEGI